jgi:hemoglobin-like flavoprotein
MSVYCTGADICAPVLVLLPLSAAVVEDEEHGYEVDEVQPALREMYWERQRQEDKNEAHFLALAMVPAAEKLEYLVSVKKQEEKIMRLHGKVLVLELEYNVIKEKKKMIQEKMKLCTKKLSEMKEIFDSKIAKAL